ncbi:hypothetical protein GE09DRAFT_718765 [Coniochaeta sp. 2T2.1]|nr:hypothetical protein GE09DRAFT_718765 [Coniochaeta sp. 2T2.1]
MSNIMSNRNSTPEAGQASALRAPHSRNTISGLTRESSLSQQASRLRPSSDIYSDKGHNGNEQLDAQQKETALWLEEIQRCEDTLAEMAKATLDQDFKDELSAIEQWFRVLCEPERTAALYALLQQTTQLQNSFFIQLLQQKAKTHPITSVLSPASFEKDAMSNRLSIAMDKLNVSDSPRNSVQRNSTSLSGSRPQSELEPATVNAMFPDIAAAIASEKVKFTQQTGNPPPSNRNSLAPTISALNDDGMGQNPQSPWGQNDAARPKSSSGQTPMGQFVAPALRSPRPPQLSSNSNIQTTTVQAGGNDKLSDLPLLSPYPAGSGGNWASMVNTPMVPNFGLAQGSNQADIVANAAAMKLASMATINNRFTLDSDPRKFRRPKSTDPAGRPQMGPGGQMGGMQPTNVIMINADGQVINRDQLLTIPGQQNMGLGSRPNSPGFAMQAGFGQGMAFAQPQNNGYLNPFNNGVSVGMGMGNGLAPINVGGQFGYGGHEGYLSDHSDMVRGRSPRGRRGSSKPPEDPTDPSLLQDIPSWLRSLRLHKYTDNLKDMKWTDLVELDEKALEARGVNALGARRKMLKVFEQVKEAKENGKLG